MKLDDISEMARLIEEARKLPPMTDEQRREQAASFAFGQIALTKEWADADAPRLAKLRAMCRRMAGCRGTTCTKPPPGWTCSREPEHDGPCAARPVETPCTTGQVCSWQGPCDRHLRESRGR